MKLTFAPKTFAARSFRCTTLAGPAVFRPYRTDSGQTFSTGVAAGSNYHTGATIGQDYQPGATAGLCNA
jgi:hypothetical protein